MHFKIIFTKNFSNHYDKDGYKFYRYFRLTRECKFNILPFFSITVFPTDIRFGWLFWEFELVKRYLPVMLECGGCEEKK